MKLNGKSIAVTAGLIAAAVLVFYVGISIFISGPARKHEDKVDMQLAQIKESYAKIENLKRHVFHYVTYVGEDSDSYVWFNEKGKAIATRDKATYHEDSVKEIVEKEYQGKAIHITLGYGYEGPVYVIQFDQGELLLNYDDYKELYYAKKGE